MIKLVLRVVAFCALSAAAHAQPARYQIDPEHFSVGFLVDHLGYAKVLGIFQKASGTYAFDEKTGALSDVRLVIDADSIYTAHRKRDNHLRSPDFLNAGEFREIVFKGAQAKRTGERTFVVEGRARDDRQDAAAHPQRHLEQEREVQAARHRRVRHGRSGAREPQTERLRHELRPRQRLGRDTVDLIVEFEAKRK